MLGIGKGIVRRNLKDSRLIVLYVIWLSGCVLVDIGTMGTLGHQPNHGVVSVSLHVHSNRVPYSILHHYLFLLKFV